MPAMAGERRRLEAARVPAPPSPRTDGRRHLARPARLAAPSWVPYSEIAEAYSSYHEQRKSNRVAAQDFLVQPAQI